jgi:hypothetical protein
MSTKDLHLLEAKSDRHAWIPCIPNWSAQFQFFLIYGKSLESDTIYLHKQHADHTQVGLDKNTELMDNTTAHFNAIM